MKLVFIDYVELIIMQLIIWCYIANPLLDWLPSTSRINKVTLMMAFTLNAN